MLFLNSKLKSSTISISNLDKFVYNFNADPKSAGNDNNVFYEIARTILSYFPIKKEDRFSDFYSHRLFAKSPPLRFLKREVYGSVRFIFTASRKTARNLGRGSSVAKENERKKERELAHR